MDAFLFGLAQNFIASAVVEWKKQQDEGVEAANKHFLSQLEDQKSISDRIGEQLVVAFRALPATQSASILTRLAADDIFRTELAKRVLNDTYSATSILELLRIYVPQEECEGELNVIAGGLEKAIKYAIADDTKIFRIKELQFQQNVTESFSENEKNQGVILSYLRSLADGQEGLKAQLRGRPSLPDTIAEPDFREHVFNDRVSLARDFLERGKPKTALGILIEVRKASASNPSLQLLFRLATNIGSCAIELGDTATAVRELEFALQLQPSNPIALGNGALSALLQRNPQEAIRRSRTVRATHPTDSVATSNYIQALFSTNDEQHLIQLLTNELWIHRDANCCLVIGIQYFERGSYELAEEYLRKAIQREPDDVRIIENLAHTLIRMAGAPLADSPVLNWKFPPTSKERLIEAEQLLTRAISLQKDWEDTVQFAFTHLLRGDARRLLGSNADAITDFETSLRINPSDQTANGMMGLTSFQSGNLSAAIISFARINNERALSTILIQFATAYNLSRRFSECRSLLEPRFKKDPRDAFNIQIAEHLIWAYAGLNQDERADEIIRTLHDLWPNHPDALVAEANYRRLKEKIEEAADLYTQALALTQGARRDFIAIDLADIRYSQSRFGEAAELYETVADPTSDNELSRRLLSCWYHSGAHEKALALAQNLRGSGEPLEFFSEIEANILAEIGDLETASSLYEHLGKKLKRAACLVTAAVYALRRGDRERARCLIELVKLDDIRNEPRMLLCVAQQRTILKLGEALPYLYQARRSGYHLAEVHATYAALFGMRDNQKEEEFRSEVADRDCAVTTQIGDHKVTRVILLDSDLNHDRNEISLETAAQLQILGKRKGDSFVCKHDAFGRPIVCTVIDVQSKYVHAFQETLLHFSTRFPTDTTLQPVSGSYEELRSGMFRQLDEDQSRRDELFKPYLSGKITFEVLSKLLGRSIIETWGGAIGGSYFPFITSRGSRSERDGEFLIAATSSSLLLELTSILTFSQLDLLQKLKDRYSLFVTQPILDALYEAVALSSIAKPHSSIGKLGNQYVRQEISAEAIERNRTFLENTITFLGQNSTLLVAKSLLQKGILEPELRTFLGPISTTSLFAAREHGIPLYTDDQLLRSLAKREWNIEGTSVQPVLDELRHKGIISPDEYTAAISKLAIFNYSFIALDAEAVVWPFSLTGFNVSNELSQLLKSFHGPNCELISAAEVLAEATKRIWFSNALYHQKLDLIDAFLEALSQNRPTNAVVETFSAALQKRLILVPNVGETILRHIKIWMELKLGRRGLIIS